MAGIALLHRAEYQREDGGHRCKAVFENVSRLGEIFVWAAAIPLALNEHAIKRLETDLRTRSLGSLASSVQPLRYAALNVRWVIHA
jgi:hypothetical protein